MSSSAEWIIWLYETDDLDGTPDPDRCDVTYALRDIDAETAQPVMARELGYVPEFDEITWRFSLSEEKARLFAESRARFEAKKRREDLRQAAMQKRAEERAALERRRARSYIKPAPPKKKFVAPPVASRKDALRSRIAALNGALGGALASPNASQETIDNLKAQRQRASRQLRELA